MGRGWHSQCLMNNMSAIPPISRYAGLDLLSTSVVLISSEGTVAYLNPAAESLLGVSGVLLVGGEVRVLFERSLELLAALDTVRERHETLFEHELDVVVAGHPPQRLSCGLSPMDDEVGGVLLELRAVDPHLRIARQEQSRLQQEANRELLRNLAHEIKNPLGGIRGAAQLLEHELPRESLREYTQVIIKESDRLQSLMERLLTPHRMPRFSAVNIHEVLERVRSVVLAEYPSGVGLVRDYDLSIPELRADPEQLIQAVLNIARNAVQAMQGHGRIVLRTRVVRQVTLDGRRYRLGLRCDIIDNGPGIPDDIREQIFFPLVSGREGGSGLGLAVAQSLVGQHHGTIECDSHPGETVFSLLLPISN